MKTAVYALIAILSALILLIAIPPPLSGQDEPSGDDSDYMFSITHDEFIRANENISRSINYHHEVLDMKRQQGIKYHDQSALKKNLKYLSDKSLPVVQNAAEHVEKQNDRKLKSALLQTILDMDEELDKKIEDRSLHKEILKRGLQGGIYAREAIIADVTAKLADQKDLVEKQQKEHWSYLEENNRKYGNQDEWPESVKEECKKRRTVLQERAKEYSRLNEQRNTFEQSLKRLEKAEKAYNKVVGVIDTVKAQQSNIEEYRRALRSDDPSLDDIRTKVKMPLEAVKTAADELKTLNDFLKGRTDAALAEEEKKIIKYFEDARRDGRTNISDLSVAEQESMLADQEALSKQGENLSKIQEGLKTFEKGYAHYKLIDRNVQRLHKLAGECRKISENQYMPADAAAMAEYCNTVGTALEEAGTILKKEGFPSWIGDSVDLGGKSFKAITGAALAGAEYEYKTKQGTLGEYDPTTGSRVIHQGENAFRKHIQVDQEIKHLFDVEVREVWDAQENIVEPGLVVFSPEGDKAVIPREDIPKLKKALSRAESILGRSITQREVYELALGQMPLRTFAPDNEHFEINLTTGGQKDAPVGIDDLAGAWGETQEFHAGRYYARRGYLDQAMVGVAEYAKFDDDDNISYKTFEELPLWERMRLIRWSNRLNEMSFLTGHMDELPSQLLGKMMNEHAELRARNQDPDPDHPEKVGLFTATHNVLIRRLVNQLNSPDMDPQIVERIAAVIEAERAYIGAGEIDGLNNNRFVVEGKEEDASGGDDEVAEGTGGGFGESGHELVTDSGKMSGRRKISEFADMDDETTKEAIRDHERAREVSREGELGYSNRKIDDFIDRFLDECFARTQEEWGDFNTEVTRMLNETVKDIGRSIREQRRWVDPSSTQGVEFDFSTYFNYNPLDPYGDSSSGGGSTGELDSINLLGQLTDGGECYDFEDMIMAGGWPAGSGPSGSWYFDMRGRKNPKGWCAYSSEHQDGSIEYFVLLQSEPALHVRKRTKLYGPDTYNACKQWLIEHGYQ